MWLDTDNNNKRLKGHSRFLAVTLSLAALLSPGSTFAAQQDEADGQVRHRLTLTWNDPYAILQTGFERITEEVGSIFFNLGAEIEWNKDSSKVFARPEGDILVLLLPEKPNDWMPGKNVMGVVSHGESPVIRIFFANVARTLGIESLPLLPSDSEEDIFNLTRAMSRVLAHEIIHAIAPPHPHASQGLMNPRLTQLFLTGDEMMLDEGCTAAFVAALEESHKRAVESTP